MPKRVLFVASLHHPEELQSDIRSSASGDPTPLFPSSMGQHFWERAMRAAGYQVDVFWRNLPGYGPRDIARLRGDVFRERLTPGKIATALLRRLPAQVNPDYRRRNQLLLEAARRFQPGIIWLSGDFFMPGTGRQAAGSYVGNPSFHRHGPLLTQRGCILLVHTDAPADFCFHDPPIPASLISAYMEGVSWLEAPRHMPLPHGPPWGSSPSEAARTAGLAPIRAC